MSTFASRSLVFASTISASTTYSDPGETCNHHNQSLSKNIHQAPDEGLKGPIKRRRIIASARWRGQRCMCSDLALGVAGVVRDVLKDPLHQRVQATRSDLQPQATCQRANQSAGLSCVYSQASVSTGLALTSNLRREHNGQFA